MEEARAGPEDPIIVCNVAEDPVLCRSLFGGGKTYRKALDQAPDSARPIGTWDLIMPNWGSSKGDRGIAARLRDLRRMDAT